MFSKQKKVTTTQFETIDEVVAKEHKLAEASRNKDMQRRIDLAKKLGDRVMEGEYLGVKGFMAIGFPNLKPDSKEYKDLVLLCSTTKRITPGDYIEVGKKPGVVGIKSDHGDTGLSLCVYPETSGNYYVRAEILCTRAVYLHSSADNAILHGNSHVPYGIGFVEGYQDHAMISPIQKIVLGSNSNGGRDQYANGSVSWTDDYTTRLAVSQL